uniref:Carbamoyltransferase n=1 Tax=Desulfatirhabdium butyrativorans TaxID=340467 RepID=A0A7C4RQZ4_9BACT
MLILGLNTYHADSAACLVMDGKLVAAAEEERFRRVKHWAGFPAMAAAYCLDAAGVSMRDVQHVTLNRSLSANLVRKGLFVLTRWPGVAALGDRLRQMRKDVGVEQEIDRHLIQGGDGSGSSSGGAGRRAFRIHAVEHHRSHLASSFLVSPYDSATVVSVDGFGDFVSTMWGEGQGGRIRVAGRVFFPHSLGLLYLAVTQYLGFWSYGDEYKVMGLAPYGKPRYMHAMRQLVRPVSGGRFELNLSCFVHHADGVSMQWNNCAPVIGKAYSPGLISLLGPERQPQDAIEERHCDIAASLQEAYEEMFFHVLRHAYACTQNPVLCLSGGCAMNSVANGKIYEATPFRRIYVQSAAGDGGGAIGSAFYLWNTRMGEPRNQVMDHAFWGPAFSNEQIEVLLHQKAKALQDNGCQWQRISDERALCSRVAEAIDAGWVVGWFQGRMEWGPRALGNRSILCDPRRADMKDILNAKIKRRESFRPFAPAILREAVSDWFEQDDEVPFMLQVYPIRSHKRALIPAVTHVNGTGRLQTVRLEQNPRFYRLIQAFQERTGVPILLNTSFNENEPVVCKPEEALACFLRTQMDMLVMADWVVERVRQPKEKALG